MIIPKVRDDLACWRDFEINHIWARLVFELPKQPNEESVFWAPTMNEICSFYEDDIRELEANLNAMYGVLRVEITPTEHGSGIYTCKFISE